MGEAWTSTEMSGISTELKKEAFDLASFKNEILNLPASERLKELSLLQSSRRSIKDASSFEDIFGILNSYWNYLDYKLLEVLVKMCRSEKLCQKMQFYADKVEQFKSQHVVEDFKKVWDGRQSSPPGFVSLCVQFDRRPKECNLQQLDITTSCSHFSLNPSAVLLDEIECNPLTVTWLLPPFIAPQLREDMADRNTENQKLIEDFRILAITLHGDEVYNPQILDRLKEKRLSQMKASEEDKAQINTFGYHLVDEITDEYVCPVTRELLLDPLMTTCCGERISKNAVKSNKQPCVFCTPCSDCKQDVQRSNMDAHKMEDCPQRPFDCDYCDYSSSYADVMSHQLACGSRSLPCPNGCGCQGIQYKEMKHHLDHCPLQLVQCKYSHEGCTAKVHRKDLPGHTMENMDQHLYMIKQKMEAEIASLKCIQSTIQHLPQIVPELTIYYTKEKESTSWFSPPFYTHNGGYRMCLRVDIAGYDEGAGTDVSAYIHLMRGIFDGDLKFPFQGEVTVQLVNQLEEGKPSEYHRERTIVFNQKTIYDHGRRVVGTKETQENGWGVDQLVSHEMLQISSATAVDWYNFVRDICAEYFLAHPAVIGGPGVEVEIDESIFGKRKYNRGRVVDGHLVFGGIERGSGACFLVEVEKRDAATLLRLISQHVRPESIVLSDK
ncbi:hypothetical protein EMCRGX_G009855 [Ephydatia muelleri]